MFLEHRKKNDLVYPIVNIVNLDRSRTLGRFQALLEMEPQLQANKHLPVYVVYETEDNTVINDLSIDDPRVLRIEMIDGTEIPFTRHLYSDEYEAVEFRDTEDLLTVRNDDSMDPGPFMALGIKQRQSCFVQFRSDSSCCGMFVTKEDLEILKAERKIIVESVGYWSTFNSSNIITVKTPSGKIIRPLRNPLIDIDL